MALTVTNVTLAGVQLCLWVQGSRTESSWQLLTAVLLFACWRVENAKSLEKVLQVRGSVLSARDFSNHFKPSFSQIGKPDSHGRYASQHKTPYPLVFLPLYVESHQEEQRTISPLEKTMVQLRSVSLSLGANPYLPTRYVLGSLWVLNQNTQHGPTRSI